MGHQRGRRRRFGASLLVVFGVVAVVMSVVPTVLAHHPEVSARAYCDSQTGTIVIAGEAVSWLRDPNNDGASGNPNIQIRFRVNNTGAWAVAAGGAFTAANGYGFTWGPIPWPGDTDDSVVVQAYAAAPFNNGSSRGSHREVTIGYPVDACVSRIIVDKVTDPPTGNDPDFGFDASWRTSYFYQDDNDTPRDSGPLAPGTYSVSEVDMPAGWALASATCSDGSPVSAISLQAGEVVTCTFYNSTSTMGRIIVDKVTDPPTGNDPDFGFDASWRTSYFYQDDNDTPRDSGDLSPGTYSVSEVDMPAGWALAGATCSDGSPVSEISLQAGEVVTCTFYNTSQGNIIVDKVTDPSGSAQQFEFDPDWGANFFLADGDTPVDSGALLSGVYSVAEVNLPAGWSLSGATCSDGSLPSAIDLGPGETVTCTFSDFLARGNIIVDKVTDPSGSAQQFEFDPDWGANFFLADGDTPVDSGALLPGVYSVTEVNLPAGWSLSGATCSDGSDPAAIDLGAGEVITCTFSDFLARGNIIVDKVTDPSGSAQQFEFDPDWGANFFLADGDTPVDSGALLPGVYSVAEVNLPAGWALTASACSDGSDPAAIDLGAGEVITCTFYDLNPPEGSITIIKDATPLDASGDDTPFGFSGDLGIFELKDPSDPSKTVTDLVPGTYTVTEGALSGDWRFDEVVCDAVSWSADGQSATIDLAQGEAAVCTFYNFEEEVEPPTGSITIIKDATPLDASGDDTPFGFSGDLGAFALMDPSDPSYTAADLLAGRYTITEDALAGTWGFDEVVCDALSWSADGQSVTVDLAEGEVAVCTFFNFEEEVLDPTGALTIIKDATPGDNTVFTFDAGALGAFSLKDPADPSKTFSLLEPGTYTVTEGALPADWTFQKVECTAGDWSADGRTVTVNLAEGEVATCTFFNVGELPFTGPSPLRFAMLLAGLASLTMGLALLLLSRRRVMA